MFFRCVAVVILLLATELSDAAERRPNILFIVTDDQSPETLRVYGNTLCETPNIDRLGYEGMVFDDAHHMGSWAGAVCTPSRTMIMTGRTLWNIPGAHGPGVKFPDSFRERVAEQSLPAVFNRMGYRTFRTCKQGDSFKESNQLFQTSHVATKRDGTPEGGSQWHGDRVMEFLVQREVRNDSEPFLIYLGFSHPHDTRDGTPDLLKKYGAVNHGKLLSSNSLAPPLPVNYLPRHPFDHGHPELRDEEQVQGVMKRRDEVTIRNELGREYACIENIDQQIGRVVDKLEQMGELEHTYVVFTSDHGIAVGRHGLMGKQNLYEHSWRVPLIVRGPGIRPASRVSGYTYLLDLFPTLCDLAGIPVPASVEGISLQPVLMGNRNQIRNVLYGAYCGGTKPGIRSIKTEGWKLVEYVLFNGAIRKTQLFDLRANPQELLVEHHTPELQKRLGNVPTTHQKNLADLSEHDSKRRELQQFLKKEMERLKDPYRNVIYPGRTTDIP